MILKMKMMSKCKILTELSPVSIENHSILEFLDQTRLSKKKEVQAKNNHIYKHQYIDVKL